MSLVKCWQRDLDGLHDKYDRDYLELMYSDDFKGMNALNPFIFAMTPHQGNWLPFKDTCNSLECRFPCRIYNMFQKIGP